MKKIMLLMAAALVSLSACSKSANEPAVKNQNDEALEMINLTIEGEREDVSVLDENGRALNLKGSAEGSKLKAITLKDGKVEGIIYMHTLKNPGAAHLKKGIARRVIFDVHNNKVSYRGWLKTGNLRRGELPYKYMDVFIGGNIGATTIDDGTPNPHGGFVQYYSSKKAVRTEDGMDLSVLNPIFRSQNNVLVTEGKDGQAQHYYSTGHKFKLYGEFVSFRFRMTNNAQARFNGLEVRGFGIGGIAINEPSSTNNFTPRIEVQNKTATYKSGIPVSFVPAQTYYIMGNGNGPYKNYADIGSKKWVDDAYTVYLFTPAEPNGGVRMAYNGNPNIFINHTGDKLKNIPGYWGKSETEPHFSGSKNYEKFHNLILLLRTVRAN